MDLLQKYNDEENNENCDSSTSSEEETSQLQQQLQQNLQQQLQQQQQRSKSRIIAAPIVPFTSMNKQSPNTASNQKLIKSNNQLLMNNPLRSTLLSDIQGPMLSDPHGSKPQAYGKVATIQSNIAFDVNTFHEQRIAYAKNGTAIGPSGVVHVGVGEASWGKEGGEYEPEITAYNRGKKPRLQSYEHQSKEDVLVEGSDDELMYGIWGPPSSAERAEVEDRETDIALYGVENLSKEQLAERGHIAKRDARRKANEEKLEKLRTEENSFDRMVQRKMAHLLPPGIMSEEPLPIEPTSKFHGREETNYKGGSWMTPPAGWMKEPPPMEECRNYMPKKCVFKFTGHTKGIHRIRLFPQTGHLLLSAGLDSKIKLWSIPEKKVMRTYLGHSAACRDVQFDMRGTSFLSCAFDRVIRYWNTETGEVRNTITLRRAIPYVLQFYPLDDALFVVGCSDNKILAYNALSGELVQEYNHHLAPVNTITFVEEATKMLTSGDDKKILIWEWDIGVPIKYISDPTMHSIPSIVKHPSGAYIAGQSLDNTMVVYQAKDRFTQQRKKIFRGHRIAGYACEPGISPDGRYIASGDGDGNVYIWDWKIRNILTKLKAHDRGPTICVIWGYGSGSTFFTCGWDGVIKMWQ